MAAVWDGDRDRVLAWLGQVTGQELASQSGRQRLSEAMAGWETAWTDSRGMDIRWVALVSNPCLGPGWVLANAGLVLKSQMDPQVVWPVMAMLSVGAALLPCMIGDAQLARDGLAMASDPVAWWGLAGEGASVAVDMWAPQALDLANALAARWVGGVDELLARRSMSAEAYTARAVWDALMDSAGSNSGLSQEGARQVLHNPLMGAFPELASVSVLRTAMNSDPDDVGWLPLQLWWDRQVATAGVAPSLELLRWGLAAAPPTARLLDVVDISLDLHGRTRRVASRLSGNSRPAEIPGH